MAITEARLQAECVMWYRNNFPKLRDSIWATFNEGQAVNTKLSMGMSVGAPDLMMKRPDIGFLGIEMKLPGTTHKTKHIIRQAEWLIATPDKGWFCDNFDEFKSVAFGGNGIDPKLVLDFCLRCGVKSFKWDRERFKI